MPGPGSARSRSQVRAWPLFVLSSVPGGCFGVPLSGAVAWWRDCGVWWRVLAGEQSTLPAWGEWPGHAPGGGLCAGPSAAWGLGGVDVCLGDHGRQRTRPFRRSRSCDENSTRRLAPSVAGPASDPERNDYNPAHQTLRAPARPRLCGRYGRGQLTAHALREEADLPFPNAHFRWQVAAVRLAEARGDRAAAREAARRALDLAARASVRASQGGRRRPSGRNDAEETGEAREVDARTCRCRAGARTCPAVIRGRHQGEAVRTRPPRDEPDARRIATLPSPVRACAARCRRPVARGATPATNPGISPCTENRTNASEVRRSSRGSYASRLTKVLTRVRICR